jgi:eukaryotic-like serine/threonine-protein kinase
MVAGGHYSFATSPKRDRGPDVEMHRIGASKPSIARGPASDHPARGSPWDEAPVVLGRYRLHRRLGSGAFGTVWLARDERLDRAVAVKIVPRERILGRRFAREARAAARLSHPGIVTLYEAEIDDEGAYLVSELVRGGTLADLMEAGRMSDRDIVSIAIALADALDHAHSQGIVHRDVKPTNVLIPDQPTTQAGIAKLTDFGVARVIGGDSLTLTGDVVGTVAYMAPEQAEGLEAGAPADLYSLALVVYEALTGVNPVRAGTAAQRARRLGAHMPPLRRQRRDLPRELGQGIDLALRPRARERGGMVDLRRAMIASVQQLEDSPGVVEGPWPRPRARHWRRRAEGPEVPAFPDPTPPTAPTARDLRGHREQLPGEPPRRPEDFEAQDVGVDEPEPGIELPAWPARGLGAVGAAFVAAWLFSHAVAPSVLGPAAAALIAGLAVAALPRLGWLLLTFVVTVLLLAGGRPGAALVIASGALVPALLMPRRPVDWPLSTGAPALALVGLAGGWPAVAARAATPWRRAALGATGWIWLAVAAPIVNADLYARRPAGTPASSAWMPSLHDAAAHVLVPLLSTGWLLGAALWGVAAAVLPALTAPRSLAASAVLVTAWSATLVSATATVIALSHPRGAGMPATAVLGAVFGAVVALAPAAARRWRSSHRAASLA